MDAFTTINNTIYSTKKWHKNYPTIRNRSKRR